MRFRDVSACVLAKHSYGIAFLGHEEPEVNTAEGALRNRSMSNAVQMNSGARRERAPAIPNRRVLPSKPLPQVLILSKPSSNAPGEVNKTEASRTCRDSGYEVNQLIHGGHMTAAAPCSPTSYATIISCLHLAQREVVGESSEHLLSSF